MSNEHGQCLTEDTLTEYLDGALDPAIKAASEAHLVTCDDCRRGLGYFMRILRQDVTPEEASVLQTLTHEWENKSISRKPSRAGSLPRFLMAFAVAATLVVAVATARFLLNRQGDPKSGNDVVQLLLAQHRPFESRMAGEPHLTMTPTRGADDPGVSYGLLAAEMTRLASTSHEMGRFYLLQKDFNRAVSYLEIAAHEVGAGPAVHNDLGVAYLESGNAVQVEKAGSEFRHALEADPSFAPAAFNLAVFYERTSEPAQAEAQWKRYLELDSNSEWASEAKGRLQGLTH